MSAQNIWACKPCVELDYNYPVWDNGKCRSCSDISPAAPVWDSANKKCIGCAEGLFWEDNECKAACRETHDEYSVCRTCAQFSPESPIWTGEECATCAEVYPKQPFWSSDQVACVSCIAADRSKPLWDGEKCTACPATTPLYDTISAQCVSVCPDETPVTGSNWICESCQESLPFWTGSSCTWKCPEAHNAKNVCYFCHDLDQATPVWGGDGCRACQEEDGGKYWDASITKCVSVCPDEAPKANEINVCDVCRAEEGLYWNGTSCVAACQETWTDLKICVYCSKVDIAAPAWDGECKSCTEFAGTQQYWLPERRQCVDECPLATPKPDEDSVCQHCPEGTFWNRDLKDCVKTCPETSNDAGVCITCAEKSVEFPYWDSKISACTYCPDATPLWAEGSCQKCVDVDEAAPYWTGTKCTACPKNTPKWDSKAELCRACDEVDIATPYWNGSCQACPSATPYYDTEKRECTAECPYSAPLVNKQSVCYKCSEKNANTPLWNPMTRKCVAKCPTAIYDNGTLACQECAEFNAELPVLKDDKCVSCFEATPTRPVWDDEAATCRPCSASRDDGAFWDSDAKACVAVC